MNIFTLMFYSAIAIGFLAPVLAILGVISKMTAKDPRETERARLLAIKEAKAEREAQLHEAKLAQVNNLVVLQEQKLEIEKLKELKLKKDLGLNSEPFEAMNY